MRLIDADALRHGMYHEVFERGGSEDARWDSGCWIRYRLFEKVLEEQPTIEQPERMRGKWINEGVYGEGHAQCSIRCNNPLCNFHYIGYLGDYNFCPNCGADMREDDHEID